jgi:hypothetical protein
VLLALTSVRSASAVTFQGSYRMDVFPVESNGSLGPKLACDGTDVLSGIGELKAYAYATWTGTSVHDAEVRLDFSDGANWYVNTYPRLSPGVETQVENVALDLRAIHTSQLVTFHPATDPRVVSCPFTATNVPASGPGVNADQTPYTLPPPEMRTTVEDYATGAPVSTDGSDTSFSRVRVRVFATASVSGYYGFHEHEEISTGATGPDQDADSRNHRWWQIAYNGTWLDAGVEKEVATFVADGGHKPSQVTFHAKPQHAPGQGRTELFACYHLVSA